MWPATGPNYTVTLVVTLNGCSSVDTHVINVSATPGSPSVSGNTSICSGNSTILTARSCGTTSRLMNSHEWFSDSGGNNLLATTASYTTPTLTSTTTYYVRCVIGSCVSGLTPVTVTVNSSPLADINNWVGLTCIDDLENFGAANAGSGASYSWDFDSGAIPSTSNSQNVSNVRWTSVGLSLIHI